MHSLLKRQVKLHFGSDDSIPEKLKSFLEDIDSAYTEFDSDRAMLERALDAHCLDCIARFKRPRAYVFLPELPKNNTGKVLKTALRDSIAERG